MQTIPIIVLTGGPCAGKTSALSRMEGSCVAWGFTPLIVPEAATELITSGLSPTMPEFQGLVLREILHKEGVRIDVAQNMSRPVIICDRGAVEGAAYNNNMFAAACKELDLSIVDLRDRRYTGVIFMRTAALGAEAFYTTANNAARYENSIEDARKIDALTLEAWIGTPHLQVVENRPGESFEDKLLEVVRALAQRLGVPEPVECQRKFALRKFDRAKVPRHIVAVDVDIVQTYLVSGEGITERVRARGQKNRWVYVHTIKEHRGRGISLKREEMITPHEYQSFLERRDPTKIQIRKTRTYFFHEGVYYEVDQYRGRRKGCTVLEVRLSDMANAVIIPQFLGTWNEVTDDPAYDDASLACRT